MVHLMKSKMYPCENCCKFNWTKVENLLSSNIFMFWRCPLSNPPAVVCNTVCPIQGVALIHGLNLLLWYCPLLLDLCHSVINFWIKSVSYIWAQNCCSHFGQKTGNIFHWKPTHYKWTSLCVTLVNYFKIFLDISSESSTYFDIYWLLPPQHANINKLIFLVSNSVKSP